MPAVKKQKHELSTTDFVISFLSDKIQGVTADSKQPDSKQSGNFAGWVRFVEANKLLVGVAQQQAAKDAEVAVEVPVSGIQEAQALAQQQNLTNSKLSLQALLLLAKILIKSPLKTMAGWAGMSDKKVKLQGQDELVEVNKNNLLSYLFQQALPSLNSTFGLENNMVVKDGLVSVFAVSIFFLDFGNIARLLPMFGIISQEDEKEVLQEKADDQSDSKPEESVNKYIQALSYFCSDARADSDDKAPSDAKVSSLFHESFIKANFSGFSGFLTLLRQAKAVAFSDPFEKILDQLNVVVQLFLPDKLVHSIQDRIRNKATPLTQSLAKISNKLVPLAMAKLQGESIDPLSLLGCIDEYFLQLVQDIVLGKKVTMSEEDTSLVKDLLSCAHYLLLVLEHVYLCAEKSGFLKKHLPSKSNIQLAKNFLNVFKQRFSEATEDFDYYSNACDYLGDYSSYVNKLALAWDLKFCNSSNIGDNVWDEYNIIKKLTLNKKLLKRLGPTVKLCLKTTTLDKNYEQVCHDLSIKPIEKIEFIYAVFKKAQAIVSGEVPRNDGLETFANQKFQNQINAAQGNVEAFNVAAKSMLGSEITGLIEGLKDGDLNPSCLYALAKVAEMGVESTVVATFLNKPPKARGMFSTQSNREKLKIIKDAVGNQFSYLGLEHLEAFSRIIQQQCAGPEVKTRESKQIGAQADVMFHDSKLEEKVAAATAMPQETNTTSYSLEYLLKIGGLVSSLPVDSKANRIIKDNILVSLVSKPLSALNTVCKWVWYFEKLQPKEDQQENGAESAAALPLQQEQKLSVGSQAQLAACFAGLVDINAIKSTDDIKQYLASKNVAGKSLENQNFSTISNLASDQFGRVPNFSGLDNSSGIIGFLKGNFFSCFNYFVSRMGLGNLGQSGQQPAAIMNLIALGSFKFNVVPKVSLFFQLLLETGEGKESQMKDSPLIASLKRNLTNIGLADLKTQEKVISEAQVVMAGDNGLFAVNLLVRLFEDFQLNATLSLMLLGEAINDWSTSIEFIDFVTNASANLDNQTIVDSYLKPALLDLKEKLTAKGFEKCAGYLGQVIGNHLTSQQDDLAASGLESPQAEAVPLSGRSNVGERAKQRARPASNAEKHQSVKMSNSAKIFLQLLLALLPVGILWLGLTNVIAVTLLPIIFAGYYTLVVTFVAWLNSTIHPKPVLFFSFVFGAITGFGLYHLCVVLLTTTIALYSLEASLAIALAGLVCVFCVKLFVDNIYNNSSIMDSIKQFCMPVLIIAALTVLMSIFGASVISVSFIFTSIAAGLLFGYWIASKDDEVDTVADLQSQIIWLAMAAIGGEVLISSGLIPLTFAEIYLLNPAVFGCVFVAIVMLFYVTGYFISTNIDEPINLNDYCQPLINRGDGSELKQGVAVVSGVPQPEGPAQPVSP